MTGSPLLRSLKGRWEISKISSPAWESTLRASVSFSGGVWGVTSGDFNGDRVTDLANRDYSPTAGIGSLLGNADSTGRRKTLVETIDLRTIPDARAALDWTRTQRDRISRELGMLGAYQSRLQSVLSVTDATRVQTQGAASRITDTDIAADAAEMVRLQILQKTAQGVLAQANVQPEIALRLLRG